MANGALCWRQRRAGSRDVHLMHFEPEHAWDVCRCARGGEQFAIRLQIEMWKSGTKESAIYVVSVRNIVLIQLLALRTEELHGIVAIV